LRQIPSTGGLAILFGKIAEQSAVVKTEAIDPLAFAEAASSNVKHL
jgi:dihydroxyacid dehydratase/phosphogluconate dehydratase